jgi:hypothetical protein
MHLKGMINHGLDHAPLHLQRFTAPCAQVPEIIMHATIIIAS